MSKAEERAEEYCHSTLVGSSYIKKMAYLEGYHQAERDLELTWEDIRDICRMWIESKTPFGVTGEALSIEVLKRFKDFKERKEK